MRALSPVAKRSTIDPTATGMGRSARGWKSRAVVRPPGETTEDSVSRRPWVWGLVVGMLATGCGGGLAGVWKGTGEIQEGRFFSFSLDTTNPDRPQALMGYRGDAEQRLAVCGLKDVEGQVEFQMDPDGRAVTCDTLRAPLKFTGRRGEHVITGEVVDSSGRRVGQFRAFRTKS